MSDDPRSDDRYDGADGPREITAVGDGGRPDRARDATEGSVPERRAARDRRSLELCEQRGAEPRGPCERAEPANRRRSRERTGSGSARESPARQRPTLSTDGAYALLWGVIALAAAVLSFDGSIDPVPGLAGIAGAVGVYAVARDLLRGRPPASLEYLWMGTPALLGAGVATLDGRFLAAGGLGVVALATLVEGYGWFGAGDDGEGGGTGGNGEGEEGA